MEVYAAQIDRMDQGIGRILAALERTGQLDDTLVIFLADNGACAEDIPEDVTIDELVEQADDRAPQHAQRRAGPLRQRHPPDARAGEHLPELRHRVGQPVERAVPPLQALDPRGRHLDAADRALAERHRRARTAASATRPATCPTSWRRSSRRPARPIRRRSTAARSIRSKGSRCCRCSRTSGGGREPQADVLGARGQRRGAHRQVEAREALPARRGSCTTWTPTAPSCTTSRRSEPARVKEMAAQYDAWAERCGVIPREKIVALMSSQGVTRAFWEKDEV